MHPHKNGSEYTEKVDLTNDNFWTSYEKEVSGRLSSMAKRNVIFTATIETPVRNSKLGVVDQVNMAVIEDHRDDLYNIAGKNKKGQEVHDGSSLMDYTYSLMLDSSYPGKGYSGTKKQFATLISPNGVTIKKDAESVLTNDKIRNSNKSLIQLKNKKKQMLSLDMNLTNYNKTILKDLSGFYYNKLGKIYKINKVILDNNKYEISVSEKTGKDS